MTKWVTCPKLTLDIPVQVPDTRCLTCGECREASKSVLGTLMTVPKDAASMLARKEHMKGRCPRTHGWCNASRQYCIYNMVCADEHARAEWRFVIKEELMYVVKKQDGSLSIADRKFKQVKDVPLGADVHAVYEIKKQLVMMRTLLPVSKETEIGGVNLKAPDLKSMRIILAGPGGLKPVNQEEFLEAVKKDTTMYGLIVDKIYQPSFELKVVNLPAAAATPKKKAAPKKAAEAE